MRFQSTVLAIAASLAFVNAQGDLSGVPQCAIPCFVAALPGSNCGVTDTKCQCTTGRESITNSLLSCAPERCEANEIASLAPAVSSLCAAVGVTVSDLPTGAVSSGSASATRTGSAASTATSVMSGSRTASGSSSATGSAAPEQTASGAGAKVVGYGAMAMGMAAVFGL